MIPARDPADWQGEQNLTILRGWARAGYSNTEIARLMGISDKVLERVIRKFPPIAEALSFSRESTDFAVEEALFKKAVGFTREIQKPYKVKITEYDDKGKKLSEREDIQLVTEQEYYPPDIKAQLTWLQCRVPDKWNTVSDEACGDENPGGVLIMPEVIPDG